MSEQIRPHYNFLRESNLERWNDFNAELMRKQMYKTFERSILDNQKVNLVNIPSWVRSCIVKFMPWWSHENFESLTWPALPDLEPVVA